MTLRRTALSICLVLLASACSFAQTVTGSLVGIVVDPSGSVIPDVKIQLTNQGTSATSTATADSSGLFRFTNLLPATYSVSVQAKGFKTRNVTDISVGLSENRDLGRLTLDIGNVTDEITVTAEVTPIQTSTGERSAVIDGAQLNNEAIRGREMMSFMRMLPGVVDTTVGRDATGGTSWGALPSTAARVSRASWWMASAISTPVAAIALPISNQISTPSPKSRF
ncbi:MAG: carboxypeptidase-like regulatory domain-containing protein [Acidobacteriia bacterium]|nr:carboxypeptidase-like regulatory domain-containing protein [Terriglobia bacterium]